MRAGDLLAPELLVALLADMGVVDPGVELIGGAGPPQLPAVLCTDCTRVRLPPVCAVLAVNGVHRPCIMGLPGSNGLAKGCCCMPMGAMEPKGRGVLLPRLVLT